MSFMMLGCVRDLLVESHLIYKVSCNSSTAFH
jgi:hypothetical protein